MDMARADPKISTCSSLDFHTQTRKYSGRWSMDKEIARDGVLPNAGPELLRLAARWRVDPDDLEKHTAELVNAARMSSLVSPSLPISSFFALDLTVN